MVVSLVFGPGPLFIGTLHLVPETYRLEPDHVQAALHGVKSEEKWIMWRNENRVYYSGYRIRSG
jgi:hypothetical protein